MSPVVGVLPLHRSALPGKLPANPSDLAVARAPSPCLRRFGSRGATLVASAIATDTNSAPTEEVFGGLGRRYFAGNHLGNGLLEDGDVGRRYDAEGYGPVEAGSHSLSIASRDLPRQAVDSLILMKRGIITHLSPIQESVHPRSGRNLLVSGCVGPLVVIADAICCATSEAATALVGKGSEATFCGFQRQVVPLLDLDAATAAKVAVSVLGPALSAYGFLFILRIVMSWYPKLPVEEFPYVVAFAPTEPLLILTRRLIPPLGGVDVTPVVWFGLISFLNEILAGPQGLLVLLSQQV